VTTRGTRGGENGRARKPSEKNEKCQFQDIKRSPKPRAVASGADPMRKRAVRRLSKEVRKRCAGEAGKQKGQKGKGKKGWRFTGRRALLGWAKGKRKKNSTEINLVGRKN